eukprot:SAG31_NODE_731_length_12498_cov_7.368336_3_plen_46_part_00
MPADVMNGHAEGSGTHQYNPIRSAFKKSVCSTSITIAFVPDNQII